MEDQINTDPQKVTAAIDCLSKYVLTLPVYNTIRNDAQEVLMNLYDIQARGTLFESQRKKCNRRLE